MKQDAKRKKEAIKLDSIHNSQTFGTFHLLVYKKKETPNTTSIRNFKRERAAEKETDSMIIHCTHTCTFPFTFLHQKGPNTIFIRNFENFIF
jgi:hypothetical protein